MMDKRSSDGSYERMMRQAIVNGRTAIQTRHGNTASSRKALSFMGWANALADREETGAAHSPTDGGGFRPMGMRKSAEAEAPASNQPRRTTGDPSMARSHPVLRLISSRRGGAQRRTSTPPRLTLIMGGKV